MRGDVLVEQLDEFGVVGTTGRVEEDLLEFADQVLLAERGSMPSVTIRFASRVATAVCASHARYFAALTRRLVDLMRNLTLLMVRSGMTERVSA